MNWTYPQPPEFQTVKEQFVWYLKKFCRFALYCGKKARISSVEKVEDETLENIMDTLGDDFMIGKAYDIKMKHGEGLNNMSLVVVSKVVAELSRGLTVNDITEEMKLFTEFLKDDEISKRRFFSYWNQLSLIIESLSS